MSSRRYDVTSVGVILPDDRLTVKIRYSGMRDGSTIVKVETVNGGEKVLQGSAEVAQPTTVYIFTKQGISGAWKGYGPL
jgi:fatty acid synthase subunit alpha, fungi type